MQQVPKKKINAKSSKNGASEAKIKNTTPKSEASNTLKIA